MRDMRMALNCGSRLVDTNTLNVHFWRFVCYLPSIWAKDHFHTYDVGDFQCIKKLSLGGLVKTCKLLCCFDIRCCNIFMQVLIRLSSVFPWKTLVHTYQLGPSPSTNKELYTAIMVWLWNRQISQLKKIMFSHTGEPSVLKESN